MTVTCNNPANVTLQTGIIMLLPSVHTDTHGPEEKKKT